MVGSFQTQMRMRGYEPSREARRHLFRQGYPEDLNNQDPFRDRKTKSQMRP